LSDETVRNTITWIIDQSELIVEKFKKLLKQLRLA
jgi:hypothetical protein